MIGASISLALLLASAPLIKSGPSTLIPNPAVEIDPVIPSFLTIPFGGSRATRYASSVVSHTTFGPNATIADLHQIGWLPLSGTTTSFVEELYPPRYGAASTADLGGWVTSSAPPAATIGDFFGCVLFRVTTSANSPVIASAWEVNGDYWYVQIAPTGEIGFRHGDAFQSVERVVFGGPNVVCFGRNGPNIVIKVNNAPLETYAAWASTATGAPSLTLGRYRDGPTYGLEGEIIEAIFSTTPANDPDFIQITNELFGHTTSTGTPLTVARAATAKEIYDGRLITYPANILRTTENGALIERESTNLVPYTDPTQYTWNFEAVKAVGGSVVFNNYNALTGVYNAAVVTGGLFITQPVEIFIDNPADHAIPRVCSVYLYSPNGAMSTQLGLRRYSNDTDAAVVNITIDGTWRRFSVTQTGGTDADVRCTVTIPANTVLVMYGAQIENGQNPTSLIETTGTRATRPADVVTYPAVSLQSTMDRWCVRGMVRTNGPYYSSNRGLVDLGTYTAANTARLWLAGVDRLSAEYYGNDGSLMPLGILAAYPSPVNYNNTIKSEFNKTALTRYLGMNDVTDIGAIGGAFPFWNADPPSMTIGTNLDGYLKNLRFASDVCYITK